MFFATSVIAADANIHQEMQDFISLSHEPSPGPDFFMSSFEPNRMQVHGPVRGVWQLEIVRENSRSKESLREEQVRRLADHLKRVDDWAETAKKNNLDIERRLYPKIGGLQEILGLTVEFISTDKGQSHDVKFEVRKHEAGFSAFFVSSKVATLSSTEVDRLIKWIEGTLRDSYEEDLQRHKERVKRAGEELEESAREDQREEQDRLNELFP